MQVTAIIECTAIFKKAFYVLIAVFCEENLPVFYLFLLISVGKTWPYLIFVLVIVFPFLIFSYFCINIGSNWF